MGITSNGDALLTIDIIREEITVSVVLAGSGISLLSILNNKNYFALDKKMLSKNIDPATCIHHDMLYQSSPEWRLQQRFRDTVMRKLRHTHIDGMRNIKSWW